MERFERVGAITMTFCVPIAIVIALILCGCGTASRFLRANQGDECECTGKLKVDSTVPRAWGTLNCDCIGDRVLQFDSSGNLGNSVTKEGE